MIRLFARRAAQSLRSNKQRSGFPIEPLESRTLLSADVSVALHVTTPISTLLPGEQPRDLIYDASRHELLAILHDRIRMYDGADGRLLGSIQLGSDLHAADITPDGKYLYVAELNNTGVYKVDLDTQTYISIQIPLDPNIATPGDVAFAGTDQKVIIGEYPIAPYTQFFARRIDPADDSVNSVSLNSGYLNDYAVLARDASYGFVAIVSPHDKYIYWNGIANGSSGLNFGNIYGLAVAQNGTIAVGRSNNIDVIGSDGSLLRNLGVSKAGVSFSPAGDLLYVVDTGWDLLTAFNTSNWSTAFSVSIGENVPNADPYGAGVMAVSDDGNTLYMSTPSGVRMLDLSFSSVAYSNAVTFQANLSSTVSGMTGQVTFLDADSGTTLGQGSIVSGKATLTLSTLHAGAYSIVAHYEGDANHNPGDSTGQGLTIKRAVTSGVVSESGTDGVKMTVTAAAGTVDGGTVSFFDDGNFVGSGWVGSGVAFMSGLPVGVHHITGSFDGTTDFLPVTSDAAQIVVQQATNTLLDASTQSSVYGEMLTLTATISAGSSASGGTVDFVEGSYAWGTASVDSFGQAVLHLASLNAGAHFISAVFNGNALNFGSISGPLEFDVAKAATSVAVSGLASVIYGNAVMLTATVSSPTAAVNESQVQFMNGLQLLGSAPVINGQAQLSLNLFSTTAITATYVEGNDFDASAGSNVSVAVAKAATTVSLIRSATWIPTGQWIEWRATVNASGTSAGVDSKVSFKEGTKILGTASVVNGVATFRSRTVAVGDHTVIANYLGDGGFKASASKGLKTTVVAGTTITLMVVYTPAAVSDMGGLSAMSTRVNDSVFGTNVAFWNSRIPVSLKLVYSGQVNYAETGSLETDLTRLAGTKDGYMDNIHGLRNTYKADLVSLFEYNGDAGGLGWVLQDVNASYNSKYGFNVVLAYQAAGPSWSLAHELGHNLGAVHDKANSNGPGATSYSYGWRFMASGVLYHDIMSYDPGDTIQYFSNPRVKYKGVPTGSATADVARTITFTAPYVAKYR